MEKTDVMTENVAQEIELMAEFEAARPSRKPDERIKGSLLKWKGSDYISFCPVQHKSQPTRDVLTKSRKGSFWKNVGEKESSYGLYVNVPGDTKDPAAAAMNAVKEVLKGHFTKEPQLPHPNQLIAEDKTYKVWRSPKNKTLSIKIDLSTDKSDSLIMAELSENFQKVIKVISRIKF